MICSGEPLLSSSLWYTTGTRRTFGELGVWRAEQLPMSYSKISRARP